LIANEPKNKAYSIREGRIKRTRMGHDFVMISQLMGKRFSIQHS
jgi:hypothetical protein